MSDAELKFFVSLTLDYYYYWCIWCGYLLLVFI